MGYSVAKTDLIDILEGYNTEEQCRELLEGLRWPDGIICPRCGGDKVSDITTRSTYDCLKCRYVFSVTSGTALHKTHLPLRKWILATYLMSESKKGISANQLKRMLKTTYKTAWYLNHRIRNALANVYPEKLNQIVEVDETFVGGKARGMGQGYTGNKALVVGIVERKGDVVLKVRESRSREVLQEFVLSHLDPDVVAIFTDDWPAYRGLPKHDTVNHSIYEYVRGDVHTNTMENVWSLLKRSIIGTFHHVSVKHLELYLEELAWRYSNRHKDVWKLTLIELLRDGNYMRYEDLVA